MSEDDKLSFTVPGGIPPPDWDIVRSTIPKEDQCRDETPVQFIRELVEVAPAGLLGSLVGDIQDISHFYLDVNLLREIQAADQIKKGIAEGAVAHAIGEALQRELAAYQKEKYAPRGLTYYKDMQWGQTANEFYVVTHAELLDGHNSRTGSWTAKWKINAQNIPGVNEAEICGYVEIRAWSYENCTAHMLASQNFKAVKLQGGEEKPLPNVIKAQIASWEKEVVEAFNGVYGNELDGTLKAIRRTLPITRTRLKWDLIANRAMKNRESKKKG